MLILTGFTIGLIVGVIMLLSIKLDEKYRILLNIILLLLTIILILMCINS